MTKRAFVEVEPVSFGHLNAPHPTLLLLAHTSCVGRRKACITTTTTATKEKVSKSYKRYLLILTSKIGFYLRVMPAHFSSLADIFIVVIIILLFVPAGYRKAVVTRASSSHVNIFSGLSERRGLVWIVTPDAFLCVALGLCG